uniref:Uncharacterized protein n=1 Tax=Rhizophora mucronata TaxID=61149 RepID=A0A2P2QUU3_RHIMU
MTEIHMVRLHFELYELRFTPNSKLEDRVNYYLEKGYNSSCQALFVSKEQFPESHSINEQ